MELARDSHAGVNKVLDGPRDLLVGHVARVIVLIDSEYAGVLWVMIVQLLKVCGIGGDEGQPVLLRIREVSRIIGAEKVGVERRCYFVTALAQDITQTPTEHAIIEV